mmetsp:Transcript_6284/g.13585  ORF Transcript_6284/g.13585 Transcript_6284/m.13585 type:complete len:398 (+) Transcript_6284:94-1287(+)|eukprot:CAMPEP_0204252480 /NCGR_PEP_ID=MMETSP0468-20130131/1209_1 /ASSEMBLY_ACC=CAM_ASM_000383 /TAXON_ID=2969 /ORGANISM="Oxyrrhis marina" /LENGTH=397 /DNA_ID=CAMNT_0051225917 /DNA_START=94 /DNA_END=1287 /DNA_ORIENTATION=-
MAAHNVTLVAVSHEYRLWTFRDSVCLRLDRDPFEVPAQGHIRGNGAGIFDAKDRLGWTVFLSLVVALMLFDTLVLHRKRAAITFRHAVQNTMFWIGTGLAFNLFVFYQYGMSGAVDWMNGYLLEYLLSLDNLFVFHLVFSLYKVPEDQKHKPLFWGIAGAVVFRMVFFLTFEVLMRWISFVHVIFGVFLVYTGIKTATVDEDDEDPSQIPFVAWCIEKVNMVPRYCPQGSFFVKVPVDSEGKEVTGDSGYGTIRNNPAVVGFAWRATLLFIVVLCLELTDLIFAVDSVSAKVAQIPDVFMAYTSSVFAMFGLRSMFFVVDELVRYFTFLKYGLALILVFIGVKLCFSKWMHVPAGHVCLILVGVVVTCVMLSVVAEKLGYVEAPTEKEEEKKPAKSV